MLPRNISASGTNFINSRFAMPISEIEEILAPVRRKFNLNPPADDAAIATRGARLQTALPADYVQLLRFADGGGEAFGFDQRRSSWRYVMIPFIVMLWEDADPLGETFAQFVKRLRIG